MKKILSIIIALCSITLVSCDKETEGISKLTAFPEFKMEGAAFMNVKLRSEEHTSELQSRE